MTSNNSESWTPTYGTTSYTEFTPSATQTPLSPSRYSYTSRSDHSDRDNSEEQTSRFVVSPRNSDDDTYTDSNSIEEVDAALNTIEDEITDTQNTLTEWSHGRSYTPTSSYTGSYTGTYSGTYSGTYTSSPSYVSLPTVRNRTPQPLDPRIRLSRITERTEESRPNSGAFPAGARPMVPPSDGVRRSAIVSGVTAASAHSRSATEPVSDRSLPPPGRATELIAVFETQAHVRNASLPGVRSASPFPSSATHTTTGYGYGTTSYGYGSRPSSPSKSSASSGSYTASETRPTYSSLLSPPRTGSSDYTRTGSYLTPSSYTQTPSSYTYTQTPSSYTQTQTPGTFTDSVTESYTPTNTRAGTETVTGANTGTFTTSASYTDTGSTFTPTSGSTLRRPQTSPRSPLASVRNLVSAWKERTPASRQASEGPSGSTSSSTILENEGLFGIRRRVQRAGARLRESGGLRPSSDTSLPKRSSNGDTMSIRSSRNGTLPPGFDLGQFSPYTQSSEPPLHIGLLWYLNVHASPPYRWQRCQALLYPHMLLLSWLAPGGGRGIVALDLLNCTSVQSAPSPTHPSARDDVGTVAARIQSEERDGQPLMDMLVPFHMIYADGVERLAAESLLERQKWVNRIWEAVNRPLSDSSLTRSPTGSIRTILSIDSRSSSTSIGSRSTVFVPPLSSIPDISDQLSETSPLTRHLSFVSSHHTGTVDDNVIRNDRYVYPGDRRVIAPSRGNSLRRSGSMTDLDAEFSLASDQARDLRPNISKLRRLFEYSPVSASSGLSLGKDVFVTPPPSTGDGSDKARSDDLYYSADSSGGSRSNTSSTYYSETEWTGLGGSSAVPTDAVTQPGSYTTTSTSYLRTEPTTYFGDSINGSATYSATSPSTLSRSRAVTRRTRTGSRSGMSTSTYTDEMSGKENGQSSSPSVTLSQTYTSGSTATGSYTPTNGSYTPGSMTYSGTYSGTYTPSSQGQSGSYATRSGTSETRSSESRSYSSGSNNGSYTPRSAMVSYTSGTVSGSYTPASQSEGYTSGSLTYGTGSYTPGSASYNSTYTPESDASASSQSRSTTQDSSTGYDVCLSSSLTCTCSRCSISIDVTTVARSVTSDRISEVASEKFLTVSQGSSEYLTADEVVSEGLSSPASFKSLSTIPSLPESEYVTADSVSTSYKTASEPPTDTEHPHPSTPSEYITAVEFEPIQTPEGISRETPRSPQATPRTSKLSSLVLDDEDRSIINIPPPSEMPSISSPPMSISDIIPEAVPLPPSEPSLASPSPPPSIDRSTGLPVPSTPSIELAASPTGTTGEPTEPPESYTQTTISTESDIELVSSLPPTEKSSEFSSGSTPTSLELPSAPPSLPPSSPMVPISPAPSVPIESLSPTSIPLSSPSSVPMSSLTSVSSSLPAPSPRRWAEETNISYDSSVLQPSPSIRSVTVQEGPDASYDTSFLRPSGSISSFDRMSTIPPSPTQLTVTAPRSPLPPLTPVPHLPSSSSSHMDVETPSTLSSFSTETFTSIGRIPTSTVLSSESLFDSSVFESSSLVESDLEDEGGVQEEIEVPQEPEDDEDEFGSEPSTEPSLLSTTPGSDYIRSGSATPIPVPPPELPSMPSLPTPEGSGIVSVTTPEGSVISARPSLRTESTESIEPPRDLGRDLDRLAEELRRYDVARGDENRDLADNLQALRDELRDLSDYLHRPVTPQEPIIIRQDLSATPRVVATSPLRGHRPVQRPIIIERIPERPSETLKVDEAVGSDSAMTEEIITPDGRVRDSMVTLSRASSNASSISFLSSHHSDDSLLAEESRGYEPSIAWAPSEPVKVIDIGDGDESDGGDSFEDDSLISTSSFTSSLETETSSLEDVSTPTPTTPTPETPSPIAKSIATTSSLSTPTVRPSRLPEPSLETLMNSVRDQLGDIRNQLHNLRDSQGATNQILDLLQSRPIQVAPDNQLNDRLGRIEDLIRNLGRPIERVAVPVQPAQPQPTEHAESIITSSQSVDELSEIIHRIPSAARPLEMPAPTQPGISILQQLEEMLATTFEPPEVINRPPPLEPLVYRPLGEDDRPRSASPVSFETLPRRPYTVPSLTDMTFADPRGPPAAPTRPRRPSRPPPTPAGRREQPPRFFMPEPSTRRFDIPPDPYFTENLPRRSRQRPTTTLPPPRPVFEIPERITTAPPTTEPKTPPRPSWYRSRQKSTAPPSAPSAAAPQQPQTTTTQMAPASAPAPAPEYIPMPPGPTQVQIPPIFDNLVEILRENRLAQMATVDQQRELMRYMQELNDWLGRDVRDRQAEIRGVNARIESLRQELRYMGMRGGIPSTISSTTVTESSGSISPEQQPGHTIVLEPPRMTMPQPSGILPGPAPGFPQPSFGQPNMPVIPPPIPPDRDVTPEPAFTPVIPGHHRPVVPGVIPNDGYRERPAASQHPTPASARRPTPPREPFIPPSPPEEDIPMVPPPRTPRHPLDIPHYRVPSSPTSSSTSSTRTSNVTPSRYPSSRGSRRSRRTGTPSRAPSQTSRRRRSATPSSRSSSRSHSPTRIIVQQPTVPSASGFQPPIVQIPVPPQPPQPGAPTTVVVPGTPQHPDLAPQPGPQAGQPTIIIQQPPQAMPPPGMPQQPMPTMIPTIPSAPGTYYTPGTPSAVMIRPESSYSSDSRSSRSRSPRRRSRRRSRSRSPSRTHRTSSPRSGRSIHRRSRSPRTPHMVPEVIGMPQPPMVGVPPTTMPQYIHQPAPPIVVPVHRSRSRSSSRTSRSRSSHGPQYYPTQPPSIPVMVPSHMPTQVLPPVIMSRTSSRSSRRRSRSPIRPIIDVHQPAAVPSSQLPTVIPQVPTSQPPQVIIPGATGPGVQPIVLQDSRSSRSPTPVIIPSRGRSYRSRSRSPRSRSPRHRTRSRYSRSPSRHHYTEGIAPSRYPSRHSPTIVVQPPHRPEYGESDYHRRGHRSPPYYSPRRRSRSGSREHYHSYSPSYSPHRRRRTPSRSPRGSRRRDRPRPSRSPARDYDRRRSPQSDYDRHSPGSPARSHHTPLVHRPSVGAPSSPVYDRPAHSRPPSVLPVPPSGRHPTEYSSSTPSSSIQPITIIPPSRSPSHRPPHRPPTVLDVAHPEEIHPYPIQPTLSRTPSGRRPSDGRYTPTPSTYGDYGDQHHRTAPVVPGTPRPRPPDLERHSPGPSIVHLPPEMHPEIHPGVSRRPSEVRSGVSRRPSEVRPGVERRPSGHPPHEFIDVPTSEISQEPLPVPPRGVSPPISVIHPPPRHESVTPVELHREEEDRERNERLGALERHLHDTALAAAQAEDEREGEFRRNEEHRERIFLDSQERRDKEARERAEHIWDELEHRLQTLPPPHEVVEQPPIVEGAIPEIHPETPRPPTEVEGVPADRASIASVKSMVERVASQHAEDILETVRLEREEFAREREAAAAERAQLLSEAEETRRRLQEEQEARIHALENELAAVKADLENERQAKVTEDADLRERQEREFVERDEAVRAQLADITNLLQDNRDCCYQKKADSDARYQEKLDRRPDKEAQWIELREMVRKIHDDLEAELQRADAEREEARTKPSLESIIEELRQQNAEQRQLLQELSDSWRSDCERHHRETIEAVKSTAHEQVPFNVQGYLNEFSKALAAEVRMLLGEVGKLREERRNLQHEMGFLLCMKSKYGPGGEFQPDWQPATATAPPPEPPGQPEGPPEPQPPPKGGWRPIGKRKGKKKDAAARAAATAQPAPVPPVPAPSHTHMDPRRQLAQSWTPWYPDPSQVPSPPSVEPNLVIPHPQSPGLFGTPSTRSWE